jgi:iron complex transport system permease protein
MATTAIQTNWPSDTLRPARRLRGARAALIILVALGVPLFFILELTLGTTSIPVAEVIRALTGGATRDSWREIVLAIRLPRAVTAMVSGAALAAGGLLMQTVFRNPLAGPWVLGITAGARLGVAFILFLNGLWMTGSSLGALQGIADASLAVGACAGSALVLLLVAAASRRVNAVTLLIVGLMIQYLAPALDGILAHLTPDDQRETWKMWFFSAFDNVTWPQLRIMIPLILICAAAAVLLVKPLNGLLLGEAYAESVGVNVKRTRALSLACMLGLSGIVTAYCGPVSFLDLAVPHLCRGLLRTSDHRLLLPAVLTTGAALGLAADFILHLPWEKHVFHLDYLTALIGAPVILWVVLRRRSQL